MGVRRFKEHSDELKAAIQKYNTRFDTEFPDYHFIYSGKTDSDIVAIIEDCLEQNKTVYMLHYIEPEDDSICW